MVKAVVFDFDGVIVDTERLHYQAFLDVAEKQGISFDYDQYVDRYIGFDDRDGFRAIMADAGRPHCEPDVILRMIDLKATAFEQSVAQGVAPIPGVLDLIEHLRPQVPLALASGATRRDIEPILAGLNLSDCFQPIITADDVEHSKPHPDTYLRAVAGIAERHPDHDIEPGQCLAIEDTHTGVESARGAGLGVLAITTTTNAKLLHRAGRIIDAFDGLTLDTLSEWFG